MYAGKDGFDWRLVVSKCLHSGLNENHPAHCRNARAASGKMGFLVRRRLSGLTGLSGGAGGGHLVADEAGVEAVAGSEGRRGCPAL